jgi:hypothetical protein
MGLALNGPHFIRAVLAAEREDPCDGPLHRARCWAVVLAIGIVVCITFGPVVFVWELYRRWQMARELRAMVGRHFP